MEQHYPRLMIDATLAQARLHEARADLLIASGASPKSFRVLADYRQARNARDAAKWFEQLLSAEKKAAPKLRASCPSWPDCGCIIRGNKAKDCT